MEVATLKLALLLLRSASLSGRGREPGYSFRPMSLGSNFACMVRSPSGVRIATSLFGFIEFSFSLRSVVQPARAATATASITVLTFQVPFIRTPSRPFYYEDQSA